MRGFDDQVRARLRPFVTALPRYTQINVNTASAEVLAAMIDDMDLDVARTLVAQRERAYFTSVEDFASRIPGKLAVPASGVVLSSQYFIVTLNVNFGQAQARGAALLARDGAGWPAVVWRKTL